MRRNGTAIALGMLVLGGAAIWWARTPPRGPAPRPVAAAPAHPDALARFTLAGISWGVSDAGAAYANLSFDNENDYAVSNPVVSCSFNAADGSAIRREAATIFRTFPAQQKVEVPDVPFTRPRADDQPGSCQVIGAN